MEQTNGVPQEAKEPQTNKPIDPDVEDNKVLAALSYVWILCLVPLLAKRDSKFTQHHAKQGLILCIIEIFGWMFYWIPVIGWLLGLTVFIVAILGIIKALNGEEWEIPYIFDLSKKIKL